MCAKCIEPGPREEAAAALRASARGRGEGSTVTCPVCEEGGVSVAYQNWINAHLAAAWHRRQDFSAYYPDVHTVYYSSNRGASVGLFHNPHHLRQLTRLGLRPSSAFGCALNYLLFPRPETMAAVAGEMREVLAAELVIGIQIRTGDDRLNGADVSESKAEKYREWIKCAQTVEERLGLPAPSSAAALAAAAASTPAGRPLPALPPPRELSARWLIVSDSLTARKAVKAWYGNKTIVHVGARPAHVSTSGTQDLGRSRLAAAEHWLFGMTDYQVVTWWGGFGRTAAMRSLREMSMWAVREDEPYECSLGGEESIWESGEAFSGVRRRSERRR